MKAGISMVDRNIFFLQHMETAGIYFSYFILCIGLFQNVIYTLQLPLAARELFRMRMLNDKEHSYWLLTSDITLPISIIIPAYNEEPTITETVSSTLSTEYPSFELVVINDGSIDRTLQKLIDGFNLIKSEKVFEKNLEYGNIRGIYTSTIYPNLVVIDKENGGRSSALNVGLDISKNPLVCTLDADSILDPQSLLKTVQPFIEDPEKVVAAGGTIRILNGCEVEHGIIKDVRTPGKLIPLFQLIEYIRAFLMGRLAWSRLGIVTILSGAFSIFRRDIAVAAGGFSLHTISEDFELVMKIHKYCSENKIDYKMCFVPEPVCWTEVPETLSSLKNQRIRWQQGGLEVFFTYIKMFLNPAFGRIGTIAYPLLFIFDVLGPLAELSGYILITVFYFFGYLNYEFMAAFFCLFFVFGIFISICSLVLEELSLKRFSGTKSLLKLGFVAILENFGYRQLNNIWRIMAWWRFLRKKQIWGEMTRVGTKTKV